MHENLNASFVNTILELCNSISFQTLKSESCASVHMGTPELGANDLQGNQINRHNSPSNRSQSQLSRYANAGAAVEDFPASL